MIARIATALLLAAVLLIAPAAAEAGSLRKEGSLLIYQGSASATDGVRVTEGFIPAAVEFTPLTANAITVQPSAVGCTDDGFGTIECPLAAVTRVYVITGSAYDRIETRYSPFPATVQAGGGDDEIYTGPTDDEVEGGAGADLIDTWPGADTLRGGTGRDTLRPGGGSDHVEGGSQYDSVDYSDRANPVRVTLGGTSGNGETGENDTIAADVEDAAGGAGADRLAGTAGSNELVGNNGADELIGGSGYDVLDGGAGNDRLVAQDGALDHVTCATGSDTVFADAVDALSECEAVDVSNALQPDRDADGINAPIDCDDLRADVHPGAGDVPDDGVDQDCAGGDATNPDRDGDGFLRPEDCDDSRAKVNPGATEIPGNRRDDDCDGSSPSFDRPAARVRNAWTVYADGTRATKLAVSGLLRPGRVQVACKGDGCPKRAKTFKAARSARPLDVRSALGRARLKPGAVVTVKVTKADTLTKVVRYTVRALKIPKAATTCRAPGKQKEREC